MCLYNNETLKRFKRPSRSLRLAVKVFEVYGDASILHANFTSGQYAIGSFYRDKKKVLIDHSYRTGYHAFRQNVDVAGCETQRFVLLSNITATGEQFGKPAIVGRAMYILTDEEAKTVEIGEPIPKELRKKFWSLYNQKGE